MVRSSWKLYYIVFERDVIRLVEQAVCRGRRSVIQRCRAITHTPTETTAARRIAPPARGLHDNSTHTTGKLRARYSCHQQIQHRRFQISVLGFRVSRLACVSSISMKASLKSPSRVNVRWVKVTVIRGKPGPCRRGKFASWEPPRRPPRRDLHIHPLISLKAAAELTTCTRVPHIIRLKSAKISPRTNRMVSRQTTLPSPNPAGCRTAVPSSARCSPRGVRRNATRRYIPCDPPAQDPGRGKPPPPRSIAQQRRKSTRCGKVLLNHRAASVKRFEESTNI